MVAAELAVLLVILVILVLVAVVYLVACLEISKRLGGGWTYWLLCGCCWPKEEQTPLPTNTLPPMPALPDSDEEDLGI